MTDERGARLSGLFGFEVEVIWRVRYMEEPEPPYYMIVMGVDAPVELVWCDVSTLLSQTKLRHLLFDQAHKVLPSFTRKEWDDVRQAVLEAVLDED